MSESIYGNINTEEIWEMNSRDGEEMKSATNADTIKSHDVRTGTENQIPQHTGSDSVRIRSSGAAVVCLVLLCVLLLPAVIVLCVQVFTNIDPFQTKSKIIMEERDQLLTRNENLTEERDQLLTNISNLVEEKYKLLDKNINITNERDRLISKNINLYKQNHELWKSLHGKDGWTYYNFSLYSISTSKNNWNESRKYCMEKGADLIIINNKEENEFLNKFPSSSGVWIGLTDSDVKGRWKWVDGTNMTSGFWASGEPNGDRENNCAVSYSSGWYDYQCNNLYKYICEKSFVKYHIP